MDVNLNVALIGVCGVVFTAILGLVAAYISNRALDRELFQSALEFLTGRTQNRSVGIALLRSYGNANTEKKDIIREIFRAQAMHLLDGDYGVESTGGRRIERYNLLLLKEVLASWGEDTPDQAAKDYAGLQFGSGPPPR